MDTLTIIMISITVLIMIACMMTTIGKHFHDLYLNRNVPKDSLFGSKEEKEATSGEVRTCDIEWLTDKENSTIESITSFDKLKLNAYQVINKNTTNKWVITVHGYTSQAENMSTNARRFYDLGYNVIVPNLRGHGTSEGKYITMGYYDKLDIVEWINHILEIDKNAQIVLHGVSMGAMTVISTSGEELPENVKAIIADCGPSNLWDMLERHLGSITKLPKKPVMYALNFVTKIKSGHSIKEVSPIDQARKSKTPILYIHGDKDVLVPHYMMEELYNATNCDKEMLTVKDADHAKAPTVNPKLYWNTVENFINKYVTN